MITTKKLIQKKEPALHKLIRLGLACPYCKTRLKFTGNRLVCSPCTVNFFIKNGIPLLFTDTKNWEASRKKAKLEYEKLYRGKGWFRAYDSSYTCLATIARGNRVLDVACGEGWLEQLTPHCVGLDFSFSALKRARQNGAQYLVAGTAEELPFVKDAFDLTICAGSLEHFAQPLLALSEMRRVSLIQVITAHREFSFPLARTLRQFFFAVTRLPQQPIERPLTQKQLEKMLSETGLRPVFKGVWTFPVLFNLISRFFPQRISIPSSHFVMTTRN